MATSRQRPSSPRGMSQSFVLLLFSVALAAALSLMPRMTWARKFHQIEVTTAADSTQVETTGVLPAAEKGARASAAAVEATGGFSAVRVPAAAGAGGFARPSCRGENSGDGTFFYPSEGSCGTVHTQKEMIVALNEPDMDNPSNPNKNPKCGTFILVCGPAGSAQLKIVDTCPECLRGSLDMSPAAFKAVVGDLSIGRYKGVRWEYMEV